MFDPGNRWQYGRGIDWAVRLVRLHRRTECGGGLTADVDIQPGHTEKGTLGFLLNTAPCTGGRSAARLAWAGLYNP